MTYFVDPLLYWIAYDWGKAKAPTNSFEKLAENVAHEENLRRAKVKNERFGYLSSRKGEIDFVQSGSRALEIKWQAEARGLSRAYLDCIWPIKKVWTQQNFLED